MARERPFRIMVVDDDPNVVRIVQHILEREGWSVEGTTDPTGVVERLREQEGIGLVFLDIRMPQRDGIEVLREIKRFLPAVQVVMITAHGSVELAVEAMREGAADFVEKPFPGDRLLAAAERAARLRELEDEVERLRADLRRQHPFEGIVGSSPAMARVMEWIARAANTDSSVLLLGESGTGKDLVARTIHYNSARAGRPFIAVNCAALPRELVESELFGHQKGAFTGAVEDAVGIFRAAQGGTVLLDEIVEMPPVAQAKLLRVLQERRVRPVGSTQEVPLDVRVIAATNRDIEEAVRTGAFRRDLYYRVSVITLALPPLRERREDIPALVDHFVARFNRRSRRRIRGVEPRAMEALAEAAWEGNVRQLENAIEHAFAMARGSVIGLGDLPPAISRSARASAMAADGLPTLEEVTARYVRELWEQARGNVSAAARAAGVTRKRMYRLLQKYARRRPSP